MATYQEWLMQRQAENPEQSQDTLRGIMEQRAIAERQLAAQRAGMTGFPVPAPPRPDGMRPRGAWATDGPMLQQGVNERALAESEVQTQANQDRIRQMQMRNRQAAMDQFNSGMGMSIDRSAAGDAARANFMRQLYLKRTGNPLDEERQGGMGGISILGFGGMFGAMPARSEPMYASMMGLGAGAQSFNLRQ